MSIEVTKLSQQASNSQYSQSGTGSGDLRYKKALKEITKLINLNTSLKRQAETWQENYRKLEQQYERLVSKYEQQQAKSTQPITQSRDSYYMPLSTLNTNNLSIKKSIQQENVQTSQEIYKNLDEKKQKQYIERIKEFNLHIAELEQKIGEKDDVIAELQEALENKHSKIIQLEGRCGDLNQELFRSKAQRDEKGKMQERERESNITVDVSQQLMKQKRRVSQLQTKLIKAEQWSKTLQSQYEQLRKQVIFSQQSISSSQSISGIKLPNISKMTSAQAELMPHFYKRTQSDISPLLQKQIEIQLNHIRREFQNKKLKYKQVIQRYKLENGALSGKINSMLQLIHKQQEYIESFAPTSMQAN